MDSVDLEIEAYKEKSRALVEELYQLNKKTCQLEAIKKSKENLEGSNPTYNLQKHDGLTTAHISRKPNEMIKPEVRDSIRQNILQDGMTVSEAMKVFHVSRRQIQRIKAEDPKAVKPHKKRRVGKITDEIKADLLLELEEKTSSTLKEMTQFVQDRFGVLVSTQAISNLIHEVDVSWKLLAHIPPAWNRPDVRTQRAEFVNRRAQDLGRMVVFVDEAGFDLQLSRASGNDSAGKPAVLSLVPKAKQVTLIGALTVDGFVYHELLNVDGTKSAKGVGADEFSLFLRSLGARLPRDSVIIMDQAPIHRGARVAEALQSMQDSQSIHVRFLPPYSPFLNPLEHCFLAIKSHVSSKEPTNRASVVAAINAAILDATTPQKSQLFFSHCQRLYPPCAEQQEITGPVLANPMAV